MTYIILTPGQQIPVEVDDLELLLDLLSENELEWHYISNVIAVWEMVARDTKIRERVDNALALFAQPKTGDALKREKKREQHKPTFKRDTPQRKKITELMMNHPAKKVELKRTAEEWQQILAKAKGKLINSRESSEHISPDIQNEDDPRLTER